MTWVTIPDRVTDSWPVIGSGAVQRTLADHDIIELQVPLRAQRDPEVQRLCCPPYRRCARPAPHATPSAGAYREGATSRGECGHGDVTSIAWEARAATTTSDVTAVSTTLAGAFATDPVWGWAFPEPAQLEVWWRFWVQCALAGLDVHPGPDSVALAPERQRVVEVLRRLGVDRDRRQPPQVDAGLERRLRDLVGLERGRAPRSTSSASSTVSIRRALPRARSTRARPGPVGRARGRLAQAAEALRRRARSACPARSTARRRRACRGGRPRRRRRSRGRSDAQEAAHRQPGAEGAEGEADPEQDQRDQRERRARARRASSRGRCAGSRAARPPCRSRAGAPRGTRRRARRAAPRS